MLIRYQQSTVIALLSLALGPAVLRADGQAEPQPVGHPRVIADISGCTTPYYRWISRDRVLLLLGAPERRDLTDMATVDLPASLRKPVRRFREVWTEMRKKWPVDGGVYTPWLSASPDGRWLLFKDMTDANGTFNTPQWTAFSFDDGSSRPQVEFLADPRMSGIWMPDSRQLLSTANNRKQFGIWSLTERGTVKVIPLPTSDGDVQTLWERYDRCWVSQTGKLFFLSKSVPTRQCELREFKSPLELNLVRLRTVTVPPCSYLVSSELSQDGKLLAWNVARKGKNGAETNETWITDVETDKSRLLVVDIRISNGPLLYDPDHPPSDVQMLWRPGTTEISYNSGGELWVVDARPK